MEVGVDLNAKYTIMYRKTVLIPEYDEATLSLTIVIHRNFNICNSTLVSLNFFTILPTACVVGRFCKPYIHTYITDNYNPSVRITS